MVVVAGVLLLAGFVGWRAWNSWPPLGRYRMKRNREAMRATVEGYLTGRVPLDSAAHRLADGMKRDMYLGWAEPPESGEGAGSLTAWSLVVTPAGYSPTDPRMKQLEDRAFMFFVGPERYEEFQRRIERMGGQSPP